jgi:hypothetical protein
MHSLGMISPNAIASTTTNAVAPSTSTSRTKLVGALAPSAARRLGIAVDNPESARRIFHCNRTRAKTAAALKIEYL